MANQQHIIDALQELIRVCHDGQQGYQEASERVRDPRLKQLLAKVSLERAKFAGDLESEATRWGEPDVEHSGSTLGAIHRGWTSFKGALGGGDDSILSSIETGDEGGRKEYAKHINDERLPEDIRGIIRNQAQAMMGTLDRIRAMRQEKAA